MLRLSIPRLETGLAACLNPIRVFLTPSSSHYHVGLLSRSYVDIVQNVLLPYRKGDLGLGLGRLR